MYKKKKKKICIDQTKIDMTKTNYLQNNNNNPS